MATRHSEKSDLKRAIGPFRRRVTIMAMIEYMLIDIILILAYIGVCMGVSFVIPFVYMREFMVYGSMIIFSMSILVFLSRRPSWEYVAKTLDSHGLRERVMTALELEGREDIYARLQRTDTIAYLDRLSPKIIGFSISKTQIYVTIGLCVAILTLAILPNPKMDLVKKHREMGEHIKEMAKEVEEKADKDLEEVDGLSEEGKKELQKLLSLLAQELEGSKDYKEAAAKVSNAQDEIDKVIAEHQRKELDMLSDALKNQDMVSPLGEAIAKGDKAGVKDEIDKLKRQLQEDTIEREIMDALSKAFREVAQEISDGALKEQLMTLADEISESIGGALEGLDNLEGQIYSNMDGGSLSDPGDMKYLLQEMKNSMLDGVDALTASIDNGTSEGSQAQEGESGGQGSEGTGQQGDAGQGSTGQGGGTGQGGTGQGSGIGRDGHDNTVGDPDRLGDGDGQVGNVKGAPSNTGRIDTIEIRGGIGGESVPIPYNKIIGTYRRQAIESLDRKALPQGLEDIVRDYFNGLEE